MIKKFLGDKALLLGAIAVVGAALTLVVAMSFPYRIHPGIYVWWIWGGRIIAFSLVASLLSVVSALALGIKSRRWSPIVLAALSIVLLYLSTSYGAHSGPNPQAWCYNHLRAIEGAKSQLAFESGLTNGSTITEEQVSRNIDGGFDTLKCAKRGKYSIGAIGVEARCSVHGAISEMERGWQKEMHK